MSHSGSSGAKDAIAEGEVHTEVISKRLDQCVSVDGFCETREAILIDYDEFHILNSQAGERAPERPQEFRIVISQRMPKLVMLP